MGWETMTGRAEMRWLLGPLRTEASLSMSRHVGERKGRNSTHGPRGAGNNCDAYACLSFTDLQHALYRVRFNTQASLLSPRTPCKRRDSSVCENFLTEEFVTEFNDPTLDRLTEKATPVVPIIGHQASPQNCRP